jgi:hypothetical protein
MLQGAETATQAIQSIQLGTMANPSGLQLKWSGSMRRTFDRRAPEDPWSCLEGGGILAVTPAYGMAGLFAEWQPLPVLVLHVEGDYLRTTGHYGGSLSFAHSKDAYGQTVLDARRGDEEATSARRAKAQMTLQYQAGQVVFRAPLTVVWTRDGGRGPWIYDPQYDTLLRDGDRLQDFQLQVGWAQNSPLGPLTWGPAYQVLRTREAALERRRAGLFAYLARPTPLGPLGRPYLALQAGRDLRDPNRTGQTYLEVAVGGRLGR